MKVCVLGGAGYIGSHAVYELVRDNHEVVVIDNLSTGKRKYVHKSATFYECDITDSKKLEEIFKMECDKKTFDVVMHFAAKLIVPESVKKPLLYYHNNVEGMRVLLETMTKFNIKNIIFSSTAAVYGEPKNEVCLETDETVPINPYGETKLACEKMIKWVSETYDMNYCIFRYFNVAGADDSLEIGLDKEVITWIVPIANETALGIRKEMYLYGTDYPTKDGTCIRDYIHVTDLARAHVLGAKYIIENNKSITLNLGSNEGYSVKEVLETVREVIPLEYKIGQRREGDPAKLIASNKKAREILGWIPKYSLKDMVVSDLEFRKKLTKKM